MALHITALVLCLASSQTLVSAQYGPEGNHGPGNFNPGGYGPGNNNDPNGNPNNPFTSSSFFSAAFPSYQKILIAHGVLASVAFVILFPTGSILIRLGAGPRIWLIHGVFQIFAYVVFTAAFGLGVYMIRHIPIPQLRSSYHPIIGITVWALMILQPLLGWLHHARFRKVGKRGVASYGHIWLGRILITLGMINGGLGLLLAKSHARYGGFAPTRGECIAYGVVAALMWLAWVAAAVVGEKRRKRDAAATKVVPKNVVRDSDSGRSSTRRSRDPRSGEVDAGEPKSRFG